MALATLSLIVLLSPALPVQDDVLSKAKALYQSWQLADADDLLVGALENGGADAHQASLLLADVRIADGRADEAIEVLDALGTQAYDVSLALGLAYVAWADQLASQGAASDDIEFTLMDAQTHLERAAEAAPADDVRAIVQLGNLSLYRFGDHAKAQSIASRALAQSPDNGELLLLRGCAGVYAFWNANQAGNDQEAQSAWQQSVDDLLAADENLPRERVEPWGQLVWLYETTGKGVEAVEAAIEIVQRNPDVPFDKLYELAKRYAAERNFDASGKALEKIVSLSARELTNRLRREEDKAAVATDLSWAVDPFVKRNDQATARSILSAIIASNPESPVVWDNYAVMCEETSRYEDAVKAYERRIEMDDSDPRPYNDLATVLHFRLNRDKDRAVELYKKCVAMADEELARADLDPTRREHVAEARRVAQGNLEDIEPQQKKGLLDTMLEGLKKLDLPEAEGTAEDESATAEGSGGTADASTEGS